MTNPEMSIRQMKELRKMAAQLGFWSDVVHWDKEIKKAEANGR